MPGRKTKSSGRDSCLFPFHSLWSSALVAGANAQLVAPVQFLTARGAVEADAWAHFRIKSLKFKILDCLVTAVAAGFVGGVQDTPPATIAAVMELLASQYYDQTYTVQLPWVSVAKDQLAGPLPWYKTVAGTADATEEAPGYFCVAGTGTGTFVIEFRGVLEFKTSVATANTPLGVRIRQQLHEERVALERARARTALLGVLGDRSVGTQLVP